MLSAKTYFRISNLLFVLNLFEPFLSYWEKIEMVFDLILILDLLLDILCWVQSQLEFALTVT